MTLKEAKSWLIVCNDHLKQSIGNGELSFKIGILNGIKLSQAIDVILSQIKEV